jgi:ParB/RepB/Spo0J family partition protein
MSRAEEFARALLEQQGGGPSVTPADQPVPVAVSAETTAAEGVTVLPIEHLQRGRYQPRGAIDPASLSELVASIRAQGIVQPIVVRPLDAARFEIIAGERRWRAAQLAGLASVPVVVRELDDGATIAVALIENIQRETLNPLEEAEGLRMLVAHTTASTGTAPTQQTLSALVGKSVSWVSKRLALLERSEAVQQAVVSGALSVDAAARRPERSDEVGTPTARAARQPGPRPAARVDLGVLQSSVRRLDALADSLGLPGVDLPSRPARKDYVAAFEQRIVEILDAAHRSLKPE